MEKRASKLNLYITLSALFVGALVVTNLIANKFVSVDLGFKTFYISVGILPYPITFLVTDLMSEVYGKKSTQKVVVAGFIASVFVLFALWLGNQFNAIEGSPVSDGVYETVFQSAWRVILSSMVAYLAAQFIDIRVYHFWKEKTQGKHLWLRNNGSTIISQLVDTSLVVIVLFYGKMSWPQMGQLILDGWIFKMLIALADTPLMYAGTYGIKNWLGLQRNEEVSL
jgi:uncharacterized integral membrane protein (TIGR00697 family)